MPYKFTAEHINRTTATALVRELEGMDIEVECASMDPVFSNQMIMIVTCDETVAKTIQNRIWELNRGLCCDMDIITADELDSYL